MKIKLFTIFLSILAQVFIHGKTYYVSPNGLNANPGTISSPFTFQKAADIVMPGDVVFVRGGTYRPFPHFGKFPSDSNTYTPIMRFTRRGGLEGAEIKFINYPNEIPILRPFRGDGSPEGSGSWSLIKIHTRQDTPNDIPQYLYFEGLVFLGYADEINPNTEKIENQPGSYCYDANDDGLVNDGCALSCTDNDHDHIPDGCEWVRYNGQGLLVTGPFAWDPDITPLVNRKIYNPNGTITDITGKNNYAIPHHITVKNCTFENFPGAGLSFQRTDFITVDGCIVANNCRYTIFGSSGINFYQFIPYNYQNPGYNNDEYRNIISNNIVYGNTLKVKNQNLVIRYDGNGIIVDDFYHAQDYDPSNKTTFPNRGNIKYGPYFGRTLVTNNVIFGNGGSGLKVYSTQYVDIYHNTLFNNGLGNYRYFRNDSKKDQSRLGQLSGQASLFVQSIVDESSETNPRPIVAKGYNRIFNNLTYNTIGYPEYQAQYLDYNVALGPEDGNEAGYNLHGTNPQFVNTTGTQIDLEIPNKVKPPAGLFSLQTNSPAINYGKKLWDGTISTKKFIAYDRLRYDRDGLPDAGAKEVTTSCISFIKIGSSITSVPTGISTTFNPTDRIIYKALRSIELRDVVDINPSEGGVFVAEVPNTCNNIPNPSASRQIEYADYYEIESQTHEISTNTIFPNPINANGILHFSRIAKDFKLLNSNGILLRMGNEEEEISLEGLQSGLYFIQLDGTGHPFIIEQ